MAKWAFKNEDGIFVEAREVEVKRDGKFEGWVDPQLLIDFSEGRLTEDELVYEARKKALPSSEVQAFDGILYQVKEG